MAQLVKVLWIVGSANRCLGTSLSSARLLNTMQESSGHAGQEAEPTGSQPPSTEESQAVQQLVESHVPGVPPKELLVNAIREMRPGTLLLHIPKTAGTSLKKDIEKVVLHSLVDREGCYSWAADFVMDDVVVMLRNPKELALSLYYHCKTSRYPPAWAKALMPETFGAWITDWLKILARGEGFGDFAGPNLHDRHQWLKTYESRLPYKCYSPYNLQVQMLTCSKPYYYPEQADLNGAVRAMQSAWFVGLTEAYHESVCLVHAKARGEVPKHCNCENRELWDSMPLTHDTHNVTQHSIRDQPPEVMRALERLTFQDMDLYTKAVERFMREAEDVKRKLGVQILCNDTIQRLIG